MFKNNYFVKHLWTAAFENIAHSDSVLQKLAQSVDKFSHVLPTNFALSFFSEDSNKIAIFKKCNFLGQACFLHSETKSLNITLIFFLSLILWIISICSKYVCIIYAWVVHRWIVNRWIMYREIEQSILKKIIAITYSIT